MSKLCSTKKQFLGYGKKKKIEVHLLKLWGLLGPSWGSKRVKGGGSGTGWLRGDPHNQGDSLGRKLKLSKEVTA